MSDQTVGRAFGSAPSLTPHQVSEKTSLLRDVDGLWIVSEQPVADLLDANQAQANEMLSRRGTQSHMLEVARLPTTLYHELRRKFGPLKHNEADWKRWLNDPDNRLFRTWHGAV